MKVFVAIAVIVLVGLVAADEAIEGGPLKSWDTTIGSFVQSVVTGATDFLDTFPIIGNAISAVIQFIGQILATLADLFKNLLSLIIPASILATIL